MFLCNLYKKSNEKVTYLSEKVTNWNVQDEGIECPQSLLSAFVEADNELKELKRSIGIVWMFDNDVRTKEDALKILGTDFYNEHKSGGNERDELPLICADFALREAET